MRSDQKPEGSPRAGEDERFRLLVENAADLIVEIDAGGRIRYASPGTAQVLGYDPAQLLDTPAIDLVHPDDRRKATEEYAALARGGRAESLHRARHRDGTWRWIQDTVSSFRAADGAPRLLALGRDVTARVELERILERQLSAQERIAALSRRFLALDPDAIDDAIGEALAEAAELAGADRSCLFAPPANGEVRDSFHEWCAPGIASFPPVPMAWSTRKVRAGEVFQIRDPAELPPEAAAERQALESRGVQSVLGIPVRSGDEILGFLAFECMRSRRSWCSGDITVLRMIGELFTAALRRKRAEEELRASRAQLLQAQKLEAVGRLAGGIAHDFNNLLTVILGFSRPLLSDLSERDPLHADISEIHAAADRAAALTSQLLTFSRRQPSAPQRVDLNRVLSGLEQLLHRLLGEDIDVRLELAPELEPVEIDPHQIEQVVMNIAVNARDAMPDGGFLRLRTERRQLERAEARRLGLSRHGPFAVLTAADSGCGIEEEDRARIFDPFFTTKEPGAGTGLGLSIAYSVVEQAGGSITVKGEPSQGAVFEILLPCCPGEAAREPSTDASGAARGSECVLVVEDEAAVRRLTRRILEEKGYRVLEASDGEAALALARAHLDRIDALLTDVVMPGLGGRELARQLRERRPGLPVLFTSGYPQEPAGREAPSPLPGAFLQKPFTQDALLTTLRRTLDD